MYLYSEFLGQPCNFGMHAYRTNTHAECLCTDVRAQFNVPWRDFKYWHPNKTEMTSSYHFSLQFGNINGLLAATVKKGRWAEPELCSKHIFNRMRYKVCTEVTYLNLNIIDILFFK